MSIFYCYGEVKRLKRSEGMGTLHAWESFGDGVHPDIQAVAKGLGGGYATIRVIIVPCDTHPTG